jgi:drug/metabolite transporter (DMT)-like permease
MRQAAHPPLHGFVIVILAASLFGMLGPLSRFAYEAGMEPLPFVAWRAFIGLLGTLVFVVWRISRGGTRLVRLRDLTPRSAIALGVASVTVFTLSIGMFAAFERTTVALVLLGFYTFPVMVAAVAVALGRERLDRPKLVALALATGGMVLVVASQLDPAAGIRFDVFGFGLALGAAVSQTIFVTISRDGYSAVPTDQAMAVVLATTVALCIIGAVVGGSADALVMPLESPDVLPLLIFTGVFAAAIPSLGFLAGIRLIGGTRAGILMLFEPVVGVALAAVLLSEALGPLQAAGGAAILGAALILQRASAGADRFDPADAVIPLERPVPGEEDALTIRVPGGP